MVNPAFDRNLIMQKAVGEMKEDRQLPVLLSRGIMRLDWQDAMETKNVYEQSQQTPWKDISQ